MKAIVDIGGKYGTISLRVIGNVTILQTDIVDKSGSPTPSVISNILPSKYNPVMIKVKSGLNQVSKGPTLNRNYV